MTALSKEGEAWESRRAELNHDWLKTRFIVRTGAFTARLVSESINGQYLCEYLEEILSQWPKKRSEIADLLASFDEAMSPRGIVDGWRIHAAPHYSYAWLAEIVHRLWALRCDTESLMMNATKALDRVTQAYAAVSKWINPAVRSSSDFIASIKEEAHLFSRLHDASIELSEALSRFPHEVRVV